jgi:hypothetical protein
MIVAMVSSSVTTLLIAAAAWRAWRDRRPDGLLFVFLAVLLANAVLSYAYTKDEIVSVAGAFYALAAYASVRSLLTAIPAAGTGRVLLCAMLLVASAGWAVRSQGLHYALRTHAFKYRNDWGLLRPKPSEDARTDELIRTLRSDAFGRPAVNPRFVPLWFTQWFEEG